MSRPRSEAERRFDVHIGRHIAAARKARGMSRVKLAGVLGIDHRRLYWMETGGRCSLYLAAHIGRALGVNLFDLARCSSLTRKTEESSTVHADSGLGSKPF